MVGVLLLLFLIVPIVELYVIIQVGQWLGVLPTIALLVVISVAGAWLVKQQGLSVWRRTQDLLARGEMPANEVLDGFLILFAGALMLTPGFVTDALGLLLLIPPTRALARSAVVHRFRRRFDSVTNVYRSPGGTFIYTEAREHVGDVTPPRRDDTPWTRELGDG